MIHARSRMKQGGGISFVACHTHVTVDHASLMRRGTVPAPNANASNSWGLIMFFLYITLKQLATLMPFLCVCVGNTAVEKSGNEARPQTLPWQIMQSSGIEQGVFRVIKSDELPCCREKYRFCFSEASCLP